MKIYYCKECKKELNGHTAIRCRECYVKYTQNPENNPNFIDGRTNKQGESIMNYKKLLNKLENCMNNEELELYLSGKKRFDRRSATPKQKKELIKRIIPDIIQKNKIETAEMATALMKSHLLRLGFVRCLQKKIKLQEIRQEDREALKTYNHTCNFSHIIEAMIEIINQMGRDKSQITKKRFSEYANHVKNGDYGTDNI